MTEQPLDRNIIPSGMPDKEIYEEIMACASEYLGQPGAYHPRYAVYPFPQRYYVLSDLLKAHVLREAGDIKKYIRLSKEIAKRDSKQVCKNDAALLEMAEWLEDQFSNARPTVKLDRPGVVISMLVWGEKFINKMLTVNFKSMMAENNLPALAKKYAPVFHIQTDESGRNVIENAPVVGEMKALGAQFEYAILPDSLLSKNDEQLLYWLVGMGASAGLSYARKLGAAFHHSYPDVIYNTEFFSEIVRLSEKHAVVIAPGFSLDECIFMPLVAKYESDGNISIPCDELASLTLNSLHMSCFTNIVNNRPVTFAFPRNHSLIWEGTDSAYLHCPHMNSYWLSARTLQNLPDDRFYMSLDSEMDLICEGENFYVPQAEDKLFMQQIVEQSHYAINDTWGTSIEYGHFFWSLITHRDLFKIFVRGQKVMLNRNIRPTPNNAMTDHQIGAEKAFLFNSCLSVDPMRGQRFKRGRGHVGRIYRAA